MLRVDLRADFIMHKFLHHDFDNFLPSGRFFVRAGTAE